MTCLLDAGVSASSSSAPGNEDDDSLGFSIVLDDKSGHTVIPRWVPMEFVEWRYPCLSVLVYLAQYEYLSIFSDVKR